MTEGRIADFIQKFLKDYSDGLYLTVSSFEPKVRPADLKKITLTGLTEAFKKLGIPANIAIEFTAPKDSLVVDFRFEAIETWSMPGAPWMVFSKPFISLQVPAGQLPVGAAIGGYYPVLESANPAIVAKLEIAVGGAEEYWPASIRFADSDPGIAKVYQMATGVNLVQQLPGPFNVLTDLGISDLEIQYDYADKTVDAISIVARSNTPNLPRFGNLILNNIVVTTIVSNLPGRARSWSVRPRSSALARRIRRSSRSPSITRISF